MKTNNQIQNENKGRVITWKTWSINVDVETGQIISKKLRDRDYVVLNRKKEIEIKGRIGMIHSITECRKNRQLKLW